jgi:uncharacterized surface protein with fasciclin (FAS1) repeats
MSREDTRRTRPILAIPVLALLVVLAAACGDDPAATSATPQATTMADEGSATTMADEGSATTLADEGSATTMAADEAMGDVLEVAAAEGDLGTFLAALDESGMMEDFHGAGPFTLFIPTDAAFDEYLDDAGMTEDDLMAGQQMLQTVLSNHVVETMEDADMVMGMAGESFTTAAGLPLEVTVEDDTVMVGDATVLRYDLQASNGVVHVIDAVLIPPET